MMAEKRYTFLVDEEVDRNLDKLRARYGLRTRVRVFDLGLSLLCNGVIDNKERIAGYCDESTNVFQRVQFPSPDELFNSKRIAELDKSKSVPTTMRLYTFILEEAAEFRCEALQARFNLYRRANLMELAYFLVSDISEKTSESVVFGYCTLETRMFRKVLIPANDVRLSAEQEALLVLQRMRLPPNGLET